MKWFSEGADEDTASQRNQFSVGTDKDIASQWNLAYADEDDEYLAEWAVAPVLLAAPAAALHQLRSYGTAVASV